MLARPTVCPCCGQPVEGDTADEIEAIRMSPSQRRIVQTLWAKFGRWVHTDAIIAALYDGDESGGPDDPRGVIASHVCRLNAALREMRLAIECEHGGRANTDSFRRIVRLT